MPPTSDQPTIGHYAAAAVFVSLMLGAAALSSVQCTDAQRRVIAAHEIRVEQDCKRIDANPAAPNVVRLSCDTGELVVDIVSTGLDLAALDGGRE